MECTDCQLLVYKDKIVKTNKENYVNYLLPPTPIEIIIPIDAIKYIVFIEAQKGYCGTIKFGIFDNRYNYTNHNRSTCSHMPINIYEEMYYNNFSFKYEYNNNECAKNIKNYIEKIITKNSDSDVSLKKYSKNDEIIKFKELLDLGIITQEEFDKKKKQLLDL